MKLKKLLAVSIILALANTAFSGDNSKEDNTNKSNKKTEKPISTGELKGLNLALLKVLPPLMGSIAQINDIALKECIGKVDKVVNSLKDAGFVWLKKPDGEKSLININELNKTKNYKLNKSFPDIKGKDVFTNAFNSPSTSDVLAQ